jgi:hypothetical protein
VSLTAISAARSTTTLSSHHDCRHSYYFSMSLFFIQQFYSIIPFKRLTLLSQLKTHRHTIPPFLEAVPVRSLVPASPHVLSRLIYHNTALLAPKTAAQWDVQPRPAPIMLAGGPQPVYGGTASEPTVYYYEDPRTGQRVASLLPPDHPEMVCLQSGEHVPETRYGCLGTS